MQPFDPPWGRAKKQAYEKQEKRTGAKPGGKRQVNSGRVWHSLRDVTLKSPVGHILIDNKTTESNSYRITAIEWDSLKRDANRTPPGCTPGLQIDLGSGIIRLLVIEDTLWDETMAYIRELEEELKKHADED